MEPGSDSVQTPHSADQVMIHSHATNEAGRACELGDGGHSPKALDHDPLAAPNHRDKAETTQRQHGQAGSVVANEETHQDEHKWQADDNKRKSSAEAT